METKQLEKLIELFKANRHTTSENFTIATNEKQWGHAEFRSGQLNVWDKVIEQLELQLKLLQPPSVLNPSQERK